MRIVMRKCLLSKLFLLLCFHNGAVDSASSSSKIEITEEEVEQQRLLLFEFYEATNGDLWTENDGWLENNNDDIHNDYCEWHGVICEGDDEIPMELTTSREKEEQTGRNLAATTASYGSLIEKNNKATSSNHRRAVIGLHLMNNYLNGRVPESIWSWPHLQYLELSFNPSLDVSFQVSPTTSTTENEQENKVESQLLILRLLKTSTKSLAGISSLSNSLKALHIGGNEYNSIIPNEIYELTKLTALQMSNCAFQGALSSRIGELSTLESLDLFGNQLRGALPSSIQGLSNLKNLDVANNMLSGSLSDTTINSFKNLQVFFVENNQFSGNIPSFSVQTKVSKINLGMNQFVGTIPSNFLQNMATYNTNTAQKEAQKAADQLMDMNPTTAFERNATKKQMWIEQEVLNSLGKIQIDINLSNNYLFDTVPDSLDSLEPFSVQIDLHNNEFNKISNTLCDNENWNTGDVGDYGCDGILCPVNTYNSIGMHVNGEGCHLCSYDDVDSLNDDDAPKTIGLTSCLEDDDRSVLVSLFLSTNGNDWLNKTGWLSNSQVCDWYGVTCINVETFQNGEVVSVDYRVRKIDLSNNDLNGTIPHSIYSIPQLQSLLLMDNANVVLPFKHIGTSDSIRRIDVTSTKTTEYNGIEKAGDQLLHIYADRTPVNGLIPDELFFLSSLKTLSLSECGIIGTIPEYIDWMTGIKFLYLFDNNIRGTIPSNIQSLQNLTVLSLAKNQLTGTIPEAEFDSLPALEALTLTDQISKGGGFSGFLPSFSTTTSLKSIYLGKNKLSGTISSNLFDNMYPDDVIDLDVSFNDLTGVVPGSLEYFDVFNIYLEGNRIQQIDPVLCEKENWMNGLVGEYQCDAILCPKNTGEGRQVDDFNPCSLCSQLSFDDNAVTYYSPDDKRTWLGQVKCNNDYENNQFGLSSEKDILQKLYDNTNGPKWKNNKNWMDKNTNVCDWYGISCDESMSVVSIILGANGLKGSVPTELFQLQKLEKLSLYESIIEFSFDGIENAHVLESLVLDHTNLKSIDGVGQARSLKELNVLSNQISGPIPTELYRLIELQRITLSDNYFTGTIPNFFSNGANFPSLSSFLASDNKLSGQVPDFSTLESIKYIDLSNNALSGQIPETLLQNRESVNPQKQQNRNEKIVVDFSNNLISGAVPGTIADGRDGKTLADHLSLRLEKNKITEIDVELCNIDSFMDYDVQNFGCNAVLCPIGTSNSIGRQTSEATPCEPCSQAKHMGSTMCHNGGRSSSFTMDNNKSNAVPSSFISSSSIFWLLTAATTHYFLLILL